MRTKGTNLPWWSSLEVWTNLDGYLHEGESTIVFDLQLMLMVEENHGGESRNTHLDYQMVHTEADRPHDRGGSAHVKRTTCGNNRKPNVGKKKIGLMESLDTRER